MFTLEMIDPAKTTYTRPFSSNTTDASVNEKVEKVTVKSVAEAIEWIEDLANLRGQNINYKLMNAKGQDVTHKIDSVLYL